MGGNGRLAVGVMPQRQGEPARHAGVPADLTWINDRPGRGCHRSSGGQGPQKTGPAAAEAGRRHGPMPRKSDQLIAN